MTSTGVILKTAREAEGLTQEDLAVEVFGNARHQSLISRWEADIYEPSFLNVRRLARRLKLPLGAFEEVSIPTPTTPTPADAPAEAVAG